MKKEGKFEIDYDEFSYLVKACTPPKPICRTRFWKKLIDEYFYQMN